MEFENDTPGRCNLSCTVKIIKELQKSRCKVCCTTPEGSIATEAEHRKRHACNGVHKGSALFLGHK